MIDERDYLKAQREWQATDAAWAVFDGEEHFHNDRSRWNDAVQLTEARGIRLAITNPSFELWYLLHFADQFGPLDRHAARTKLKVYIPTYEKSDVLYPNPLEARTEEALTRAGLIRDLAESVSRNPPCNPWVGVADLVASILELSDHD